MNSPIVSVVMPAYNGEQYIAEAIDSVLSQTFENFELIVVDDGSTDRTQEIVARYDDARIRYELNDRNRRIVYTLNKGIQMAKGKFIARMDADDICFPERFERQVAYMEQHPDIGLCASGMILFGNVSREMAYPVTPEEISCHLAFYSCIPHPTVMFRREMFIRKGLLYSEEMGEAEDYELWARASQYIRMANIGQPLLRYRMHPHQGTVVNQVGVSLYSDNVRRSQLARLHIVPSEAEFAVHQFVCLGVNRSQFDAEDIAIAHRELQIGWVDRLMRANEEAKAYPMEAFRTLLMGYRSKLSSLSGILDELRAMSERRAIYLWGTGAEGAEVLGALSAEHIDVAGFVDNNPTNWSTRKHGMPVESPAILDGHDRPFIIVCSMYRDEIAAQLRSKGYLEHDDYINRLTSGIR
jgi:glycosyltransferase involved in cell wall biosynthesis